MVNQKGFPISTLVNLSYESVDQLKTLRIETVQAFVARTNDLASRDAMRIFLRLTQQEMDAAVNEAQRIVPIEAPVQEFAAGALFPPQICMCMITPCPHTTTADGTTVNGITQEGFLGPQLGALIPPELAWQEGKTAGEIALIHFVLRTRKHLQTSTTLSTEGTLLEKEAEDLLQWYGITVPEVQ